MQDSTHSVGPGARRKRKKKAAAAQALPADAGRPPVAVSEAAPPIRGQARAQAVPQSLALRLWAGLRSEPALMVTTAYLFVSFIGLWANYWFFLRFDLPILEYMQGGDYLVAGLRDPVYAYAVIGIALVSMLVAWPERWEQRNPQRARVLRGSWWGRMLLGGDEKWRRWGYFGMSRETGLVVIAFITAILIVHRYVQTRADDIRDGGGHVVRISLAGEAAPLPGQARLLGTNSSFVFLWWPQQQRVEALPTANVSRIESVVAAAARPAPAAADKPPAPAAVGKQ